MVSQLEVFCCYAREDQEMLGHLKKHLAPMERKGQITIWSDTHLNAGVEWEKELSRHLENANIILLLISPDFIASDYCYSVEMKRAIERHDQGNAHVVPILLRPVYWSTAPFAKLQVAPANAIPVTKWLDRDDAFRHIAEHINHIISERQTQRQASEINNHLYTGPFPESTPMLRSYSTSIVPTSTLLTDKPEAIAILRAFFAHEQSILSVALSADGRILASHSLDSMIKLWNVQNSELLHIPTIEDPLLHTSILDKSTTVTSMALSINGRILAIGCSNEMITLWNVQTGDYFLLYEDTSPYQKNSITSIALNANGCILACGTGMGHCYLWKDIQANNSLNNRRSEVAWFGGAITCLALSSDGVALVSGCGNRIMLKNAQIGKNQRGIVASLALSPNGHILASGSRDGTVRLWNVRSRKLLRVFKDSTESVALSTNGLTLATVSYTYGTIKLWDTQTGKLLCTLTPLTGSVSSLALSADGRILASGSSDGTIHIWGVKE